MNNPGGILQKDTGGSAFKADIIADCYSKLRISGMTVDPTPGDLEAALVRLENMVAEWDSRNIDCGYNFQDEPDPNDEIGCIRAYWQCLGANLAVLLIPDFNKAVPEVLMRQAGASLSSLTGRSAMNRIKGVRYSPRMARGSGNTLRNNRWARYYRGQDQAPDSSSVVEMVSGDISDFTEHFDAFLKEQSNEVITSFDITTDPGLILVSSSNTEIDVNYRIEALSSTSLGNLSSQRVTIVVTTSEGRVETRFTIFSVTRNNART